MHIKFQLDAFTAEGRRKKWWGGILPSRFMPKPAKILCRIPPQAEAPLREIVQLYRCNGWIIKHLRHIIRQL